MIYICLPSLFVLTKFGLASKSRYILKSYVGLLSHVPSTRDNKNHQRDTNFATRSNKSHNPAGFFSPLVDTVNSPSSLMTRVLIQVEDPLENCWDMKF